MTCFGRVQTISCTFKQMISHSCPTRLMSVVIGVALLSVWGLGNCYGLSDVLSLVKCGLETSGVGGRRGRGRLVGHVLGTCEIFRTRSNEGRDNVQ